MNAYTIGIVLDLLNAHSYVTATRDDAIGILAAVRERMGNYPTEDMLYCAFAYGRPGYRFDWREYFVDRLCQYDYAGVRDAPAAAERMAA